MIVRARTKVAATLIVVACSLTSSGQVPVVPVAPVSEPTLWSFLGIPQGVKKVRGALTNRRGNLPGTEPKEALKALNAPENLFSEVPAIKKAAEIKIAEDLKPQKIKAIKYLASIGCGCYDKDGAVTDALIASAEDCTEDVRLITMNEITAAASNKCCSHCGQVCCCNEKLLKKLAQLAYERDEFGCYTEPSGRVRQAAAAALAACCTGAPPLEILPKQPTPPPQQPKEPDPETGDELMPDPELPLPVADLKVSGGSTLASFSDQPKLSRVATNLGQLSRVPGMSESVPSGIARMRQLMAESKPLPPTTPNPEGGIVMVYDVQHKLAYVHFADRTLTVPRGITVHLRSEPSHGSSFNGLWRVIESAPGCANLEPTSQEGVSSVRAGDRVNFGEAAIRVAPKELVRY